MSLEDLAKACVLISPFLAYIAFWLYLEKRKDRAMQEKLDRVESELTELLTKEIDRMRAAARKREFFANDTQERR